MWDGHLDSLLRFTVCEYYTQPTYMCEFKMSIFFFKCGSATIEIEFKMSIYFLKMWF